MPRIPDSLLRCVFYTEEDFKCAEWRGEDIEL